MNRRQYRLIFIAAAATRTLSWAGTAAAGPITLQQCLAELAVCRADLGTCNSELTQAQDDLGRCNAELDQTQKILENCTEGVAKVQIYLAVCTTQRNQLQADLLACTRDLEDCAADAVKLPASGQTTAFNADKNDGVTGPVAVPDDGTLQAGATLSYTDNGDGTVTDNNTGLMWEKKSDDGGLHDKDNAYRWSGNGAQETVWDWLEDANAEGGVGFAGYDDWRVPNVKELASIVDYQNTPLTTSAAFNDNCVAGATVFTGSCTSPGYSWSSTTWAKSTGMAWGVSFQHGEVFPHDKTVSLSVRTVRGGSP